MAYAQRYTTTWYDQYGRLNQVYIREKGYTGDEETIQTMFPPASLELNEANVDPYVQAIRGSVMRLNLYDPTGFKYLEILQAPNRKYQVVWDLDGLRFWIGWIAPTEFQHPYDLAPYGVQITATDGLATLKNYDFDGTGKKSLMNILGICLAKIATGFQGSGPGIGDPIIYLYENINKYETNHDKGNGDSPLTQTYLDCDDVFYDDEGKAMNCYDVVNKVLFPFGVGFKMSDGAWHILQENISGSEYRRRKYYMLATATNYTYSSNALYDPVLNTTRGNVGWATMNTIIAGGGIRALEGLKSFTLTQDYGKRTALLKNNDFSKWIDASHLEDWQDGGAVYWRDDNGVAIAHTAQPVIGWFYQEVTLAEGASPSYSVQRIKLAFKAATTTFESGTGYSTTSWFWILSIIDGATKRYWSADDKEWKTLYTRQEMPMYKEDYTGEWVFRTDPIPCGGVLTLTIIAPMTIYGGSAILTLTNIELSLYQYDYEYPEEYKFNQEVNLDNTASEDYESLVGDPPFVNMYGLTTKIDNGFTIYKNLLLWDDSGTYKTTGNWDYKNGSNPQLLLQKLVSEIGSLRNKQRLIIGADVYSKALRPTSVLKEASATDLLNKYFRISNGTYDGAEGKWAVELVEVPTEAEYLATKEGILITTKDGQEIIVK